MRVHSVLSPKCAVGPSPVNGLGVYARVPFGPGELVAVWGGKIYSADEVARLADRFPQFDTHTVSVCDGYYLGSENLFEFDDAERFNHSCEPNTGVKGQIVVVTRRRIAAGEELTFDYDTTEAAAVPFECRCGSRLCRRVIDGSGWRDPAFLARNRGYLSWHLAEKARQKQSRKGRCA